MKILDKIWKAIDIILEYLWLFVSVCDYRYLSSSRISVCTESPLFMVGRIGEVSLCMGVFHRRSDCCSEGPTHRR
jgi:hypothetical protein